MENQKQQLLSALMKFMGQQKASGYFLHPDVFGSRMTGGGFGGCTISLVKQEAVPLFTEEINKSYQKEFGRTAEFYIAQIGDGASEV